MSKKPSKSRHRVPVNIPPRSAEIDSEYQAEVDRATQKSTRLQTRSRKKQTADDQRTQRLIEKRLVSERRTNRNRALKEIRLMIDESRST